MIIQTQIHCLKTHLKVTTARIQIPAQALKGYFKTNVSWIKYTVFESTEECWIKLQWRKGFLTFLLKGEFK